MLIFHTADTHNIIESLYLLILFPSHFSFVLSLFCCSILPVIIISNTHTCTKTPSNGWNRRNPTTIALIALNVKHTLLLEWVVWYREYVYIREEFDSCRCFGRCMVTVSLLDESWRSAQIQWCRQRVPQRWWCEEIGEKRIGKWTNDIPMDRQHWEKEKKTSTERLTAKTMRVSAIAM